MFPVNSTTFAEVIFDRYWGVGMWVEVVIGDCYCRFEFSEPYYTDCCFPAIEVGMVTDCKGGKFAVLFKDREVLLDCSSKDGRVGAMTSSVEEGEMG